ncbi:hypothetical protein [Psychrobacter sp. P2G3]|uniref:hypothetical protein n=1 Tax=Psychrobacter sp. P2G3 TaxID=1699622 RepID=UPI000AECB13A|nr:hypothetical protein [Psychrobacter sp. P2G3]
MTDNNVFYYGEDKIHYEVVRKEVTYKEKTGKSKSDTLISENTKPLKPSKLIKPSRPRKVVIKVHPDLRVVATAPSDATDEMIHENVRAGYGKAYKTLPSKKIMYCPSVMSAVRPSFIWVVVMC